ncbi:hypothetical protein BS78_09G125800 [Paspalum vaginatum]|nr:hypothetical protein BS78_09G125800 [Paspalum vaginatum]
MDSNTNSSQPPPGYPKLDAEQQGSGKKKKGCCGSRRRAASKSAKRGEASFIEGCIAALCCCWLCELCCD